MSCTPKFWVAINRLLPHEKLGPQGAVFLWVGMPKTEVPVTNPLLEEWIRISIPEWRRILVESTDKGDGRRAEYAQWMLREILLDTEYEEPQL